MTFPWEAPAALPMPWEAPAAPAVAPDDLAGTVKALQADVRYIVTRTAVLVRATGPQAAALGMLVNTSRGQLVPVGEARYSGGHTIQFQDLGMPQPRAPEMSIADLIAALADTVVKLGLELQP